MRRRYEIWAMYYVPKVVQRCWTRRGAEREWLTWQTLPRTWIDYEVRERGPR